MAEYNAPGSIKIETIEFTNYKGDKLDLTALTQEFNIFESMSKPFITASIILSDAVALQTQFPIIGQETVTIKFKTPGNAFLKNVDLTFRVIAIKEYSRAKARQVGYVLNLVSPYIIKDSNTKIRKAYTNVEVSSMVDDVVKSFLGGELQTLEATEGQRTIILPNVSPSYALNYLCRQAKSPIYQSSAYFFYQNADGLHFRTSDDIINPAKKKNRLDGSSLDKYFASEVDTSRGTTPRDRVTSGGSRGQSTKPYDFLQIRSFHFHNLGNYYSGFKTGFLENKISFFDPVTSFYEEKSYKYMENQNIFQKTTQSSSADFLTSTNDYIKNGEGFLLFEPTNHLQMNGTPNDQSFEMLNNKIGSKSIFDNLNATVEIAGDSEKRCGEVIDLEFPEYGALKEIEGKINKFISGEYIILSLRHIYNSSGYRVVMNVAKNAYERRIEDSTITSKSINDEIKKQAENTNITNVDIVNREKI